MARDDLRIFDIFVSDVGDTFDESDKVDNLHLYNPSNLGGGFTRSSDGKLGVANETITFSIVFKSNEQKSAYEQYFEVVGKLASKEIVWLRYAVPSSEGYRVAYRPGYISKITKTEAKYADASLIEQLSITTISSWFELYTRAGSGPLDPSSMTLMQPAMFSNFPDNYKKSPYGYPYWYGADIKRRRKKKNDWYNTFGNLFNLNEKQVVGIHAPTHSISTLERDALGLETIKGPNYMTGDQYNDKTRAYNFKAKIENFGRNDSSAFSAYHSVYISGNATAGSTLSISTRAGVKTNQLIFKESGHFVIDTADWANIYEINGSSGGIDFSFFVGGDVGTDASVNGPASTIIARRAILGI